MPETTDTTRRWSGFVCPDCRFIFRVARDHDGRGIVCPGCRRMLRRPAEGEATPPLMGRAKKYAPIGAPQAQEKVAEPSPAGVSEPVPVLQPEEPRERHKRRHKSRPEEQPDWEKEPVRVRRKGGQGYLVKGIAIAGVALATFGVVTLLIKRKSEPEVASDVRVAVPVPVKPQPEAVQSLNDPEIPAQLQKNQDQLLAGMALTAKKFLEADSVEKLLPLVRDRERVEPKLREWYPGGKVSAPGMSRAADTAGMGAGGDVVIGSFVTSDFDTKAIAFFRSGEDLKVDWESYVGWSEMPWGKFMAEHPVRPMLFRVSINKEEYYNFDYADDAKLQSYRMLSPDGEHVLYGYIRKDAGIDGMLKFDEPGEILKVIVLLKFRSDQESKNQVMIEKVLADGWIEKEPSR